MSDQKHEQGTSGEWQPNIVAFLCIDPRRFKMSWVSAAEGSKWSSVVADITSEARELGPFEAFPSFGNGNGNVAHEQHVSH